MKKQFKSFKEAIKVLPLAFGLIVIGSLLAIATSAVVVWFAKFCYSFV